MARSTLLVGNNSPDFYAGFWHWIGSCDRLCLLLVEEQEGQKR
jgi:hypothetical protein